MKLILYRDSKNSTSLFFPNAARARKFAENILAKVDGVADGEKWAVSVVLRHGEKQGKKTEVVAQVCGK
jgi:hypothetical protein